MMIKMVFGGDDIILVDFDKIRSILTDDGTVFEI